MRYQVFPTVTGKWMVLDSSNFDTVAAGMTKEQADKWADRLNHRAAWGV